MLSVALCDDEESQISQVVDLLQAYEAERPGLALKVSSFPSGEQMLLAYEERGFDIYILDILMPGLSGIETGRKLRSMGDGGEIIYLTVSNEYAADSYDVQAFFYLLKPVNREKFFSVLDQAVEKLHRRRTSAITVSTPMGPRLVLLDHILYVERTGRAMRYYCVDGVVDTVTLRTAFRDTVAPLLADLRFRLCGASFVLNLQHVTGVDGQTALLDDGGRVSLPRTAVAAFKEAWGRFWLGADGKW